MFGIPNDSFVYFYLNWVYFLLPPPPLLFIYLFIFRSNCCDWKLLRLLILLVLLYSALYWHYSNQTIKQSTHSSTQCAFNIEQRARTTSNKLKQFGFRSKTIRRLWESGLMGSFLRLMKLGMYWKWVIRWWRMCVYAREHGCGCGHFSMFFDKLKLLRLSHPNAA